MYRKFQEQYLNTKYNSEMRVFEIPHIIVFSNFSPDENMLSKDRYVIKNIESIKSAQNEKCPEVNIGNTKAMFTCIKPIEEEKPWHYSVSKISRTYAENLDHIYTCIENFKNGQYLNTKYNSENESV